MNSVKSRSKFYVDITADWALDTLVECVSLRAVSTQLAEIHDTSTSTYVPELSHSFHCVSVDPAQLSSRITYCTRGLILVSFMNAQSYGFIIVFTHVLVFAYMYSTSNCINKIHRVGICTGRNCILVEYHSCAPTIISPVRPVKHQHESNGKYLLIQRFKVIAIAI